MSDPIQYRLNYLGPEINQAIAKTTVDTVLVGTQVAQTISNKTLTDLTLSGAPTYADAATQRGTQDGLGLVVRKQYSAIATMQADTSPLSNGDEVEVPALGEYTVAASSTAPAVPGTGRVLMLNFNHSTINAEALGVNHSGSTDPAVQTFNRTQIEAASAYLSANYGRHEIIYGPEGHVLTDYKTRLSDGAIIGGKGALIECATTNPLYVDDGGVFAAGCLHPYDCDNYPWIAMQAVTQGDLGVMVQTSGDAAGFQIGDTIWMVESVPYSAGPPVVPAFGYAPVGGAATLPNSWQYNVVTGVSGSTISLLYPCKHTIAAASGAIDYTQTGTGAGFWIANTSARANVGNNQSGTYTAPSGTRVLWSDRHVARDISVYGVRLKTNSAQSILGRWSCVNLDMDDIEAMNAYYPWPLNGLSYSRVRNLSGDFGNRLMEITSGAHDLIVSGVRSAKTTSAAGYDPTSPTADENVVSIGERACDLILRDFVVDLGDHGQYATTAPTILNFSYCKRVVAENLNFRGQGASALHVGISNTATESGVRTSRFDQDVTGVFVSQNGTGCFVDNNTFAGTPQTAGVPNGKTVNINTNASGGSVSRNRFLTEGVVTFTAGGVNVRIHENEGISGVSSTALSAANDLHGNTCASTRAARLALIKIAASSTQSTSDVALAAPTLPANTLLNGDFYQWDVRGSCGGTAGSKTVSVVLSGLVSATFAPTAIASTVTYWSLLFSFSMTSSSTAVAHFQLFENGVLTQQRDSAFSGLAPATAALTVTLNGHVANAADTLSMLDIKQDFIRDGFVTR